MAVVIYPDCNKTVAHLPGVIAAVYAKAQEGGVTARAILASHRHTGASSIEVTQGDVDSFVSLVDPNAISIEFGRVGTMGRGTSQGVFAVTRAFGGSAPR